MKFMKKLNEPKFTRRLKLAWVVLEVSSKIVILLTLVAGHLLWYIERGPDQPNFEQNLIVIIGCTVVVTVWILYRYYTEVLKVDKA